MFNEVEVIELGLAEELIKDELDVETSESQVPARIKNLSAAYIADAE